MAAFPEVKKIQYEGPKSDNPLAFRWYNAEEVVAGKSMEEHFDSPFVSGIRFAAPAAIRLARERCCGLGMTEPSRSTTPATEFGPRSSFSRNSAHRFTHFTIAMLRPKGSSLAETNANLDAVANVLKEEQDRIGRQAVVGNGEHVLATRDSCTVRPRLATSRCLPYAAAQVKKALEVTHVLGGENYVFWGGREGYQNLYNTDMKRELDHLAGFFHMAVDYAKEIGFTGQFLIEPKPKEPTKHQYDFDVANCLNFLRAYGLMDHFKLNIETNHATLAGHTMMHELEYAGMQGALGSIDANTGDLLLGWDTDQFPTDYYLTTQTMLVLLKYGLAPGGVNFDAKVRRESFEPIDLFYAHIGGMDAFARGLKIAAAIRADKALEKIVERSLRKLGFGSRSKNRKRLHRFQGT